MQPAQNNPIFSKFSPLIKNTITDLVHSTVVGSLSTHGKRFVVPSPILDQLNFYVSPQAKIWQWKVDLLDAINPLLPLSGKLPGRVELPAKAVDAVMRAFFELRTSLDTLNAEERRAVLEQLPPSLESLKKMLSPEWTPPTALKVTRAVSSALVTISNGFKGIGDYATSKTTSLISQASSVVISPETRQKVVENVVGVWNIFIGGASDLITLSAMSKAQQVLGKGASVERVLNFLTNQFRLVDQTLAKIDSTLNAFPPSKVMATAFLSLDSFCQLSKGARDSFPKNLEDTPTNRQQFELHYAATRNLLPTPELNRAFQSLCDPALYGQSLKERCLEQLASQIDPQASDHTAEQVNKNFKIFYDQKLAHLPGPPQGDALQLIKAAFKAKNQGKLVRDEGILCLADMILASPQDYTEDATITPSNLMKHAALFYVKKELYPTLADQFFPPELKLLIQGLTKLTGIDIQESVSDAISHIIVDNGVNYLTDPLAISTIVLQTLGVDATHFADYTEKAIGNGTPEAIRKSFTDLLQSIGTEGYADKLKALAVKPQAQPKEVVGGQVVEEIDLATNGVLDQYSRLIQFVVSPARELGKNVAQLNKRQDFGMLILLLAGRLNANLKQPLQAPDLDLVEPDAIHKIARIAEELCPASSGLMKALKLIPKKFLKSTLKSNQDFLRAFKYSEFTAFTENTLRINHLTHTFLKGLMPFPGLDQQADIEQGIGQALYRHIQDNLQVIWGVDANSANILECTQEYLTFLEKQTPAELVKLVKEASLNPFKIRDQLMQEKEAALTAAVKRMDAILLHPIALPQIEPNATVIERRLAELAQTPATEASNREIAQLERLKEVLSLQAEAARLQNSLSLIYAQQNGRASDHDTLVQLQKKAADLEVRILRSKQILKLNRAQPEAAELVALEKRQLEELEQNLALTKQSITTISAQMKTREAEREEERALKLNKSLDLFKLLEGTRKTYFNLLDEGKAETDRVMIELKNTIAVLKEKAAKQSKIFHEVDTSYDGKNIPDSTRCKVAFFNAWVQSLSMKKETEQDQKKWGLLHHQMTHLYEEILKWDFSFGFASVSETVAREADLVEMDGNIQAVSDKIQRELLVTNAELEWLAEDETVLNTSVQALLGEEKIYKSQAEETTKLSQAVKLLELEQMTKTSLAKRSATIQQLQSSLAEKENYRNTYLADMGTLLRLANYMIKKTPELIELDAEILDLKTQLSKLELLVEEDRELIDSFTPKKLAAINLLETTFGQLDFNKIKEALNKRIENEQQKQIEIAAEKERLNINNQRLIAAKTELEKQKKEQSERLKKLEEEQAVTSSQKECMTFLNGLKAEAAVGAKKRHPWAIEKLAVIFGLLPPAAALTYPTAVVQRMIARTRARLNLAREARYAVTRSIVRIFRGRRR